MKRWLLLGGAILALVLVIGGLKGFFVFRMIQNMKAAGPPKITVSAAEARLTAWQPMLSVIATLHAVHGADLSAEVPGIVQAIEFKPGEDVKAGRLLVRLRAGADLAHLASLEATAERNQIAYTRDKAQLEIQAVSQATVDASAADLATARALANEQRVVVNKKFIRAPFDGRAGIRAVDIGQYVAAGTTLVTLQSLNPIYADFYVPQQDLPRVAVGQSVSVTAPAITDTAMTGVVEAIEPKIDIDTRNVLVRARIPNSNFTLLPGMSVNVSVATGVPQKHVTLPQSAVVYNPYGASVYVIDMGHGDFGRRVQQRFVGAGETRGDQVAILGGINEGEWVVTSGQLKLKNADQVVINNSVTPSYDPQPKPRDQ